MDNQLELFYQSLFNQLIRSKLTPTYVEKRILEEHVNVIKTYLLKFTSGLKKKINDDLKLNSESYLTWDVEYYKKDGESKQKLIDDFEEKIKTTDSNEFINIDFSLTKTNIDIQYPNYMPRTSNRELLSELWTSIKTKHD